jgi:hypothetical protein
LIPKQCFKWKLCFATPPGVWTITSVYPSSP